MSPEFRAHLRASRAAARGPGGRRGELVLRLERAWSALKPRPQQGDERPPTVIFLVIGSLLCAVGVVRLGASYWTQFGSDVWTGVLVST